MIRLLATTLLILSCSTTVVAQTETNGPPAQGDTVTTKSGLKYVFVKHGTGQRPQSGDVMTIHGIGMFANGKEFWNTRKQGGAFEYRVSKDRVIRGFAEGMRLTRGGDRIILIMKPELAYGIKGNADIPPNSTLIFDYEILDVRSR